MIDSRIRPLFLCVALAVTGCSAASARVAEGKQEAAPISVQTVKASAIQAPLTLELEGTLGPRRAAKLSPFVNGHVASVAVELGDQVAAGAPLLTLRAADFRLVASAARARADSQLRQLGLASADGTPELDKVPSVAAAKADLDNASDQLRRQTQLRGTGAITEQSYDQSVRQHAAASARYESARQAVEGQLAAYTALRSEAALRQNDASNAVVRAPFAGRVARKMAEVGEYVSPQNPVIELVDTSELRLTLQVPERHVMRVKEGQRLQVSVDGTDIVREGVVRHLSAALDEGSRSLTIEAAVPNTDGGLRAGHFARARLDLGATQELVSVPASALSERAGVFRVFVVAGGQAEARIVEVVERDGQRALVRGELAAGEAVVSAPPRGLSDGSKVQG